MKIKFIAIILFLLPSYLIRFSFFGLPTTFLEILIWAGLVWSLFNWREWKKILALPKVFKISIELILLGAIVGVFIAPDKASALGQFKGFIFDPLLFAGLVYVWSQNSVKKNYTKPQTVIASHFYTAKHRSEQIYDGLILSGIVLSLIALGQKLAGVSTPDGRVLSVWQWDMGASANYLAMYLAPIAVLLFWRLGNFKNGKKLIDWLPGFILVILAIFWSGSRAGLIAVSAGIIFFLLKKYSKIYILKSKSLKSLIWLICLSAVVGTIYLAGRPNFSASPNSGRISSSNNIRWEIWRVTIREILPQNQNWIFGIGLGNFQNYFTNLTQNRVNFPEYISPRALTPHNLYLHIWLSGGIIMLVGFLLLIWQIFKKSAPSANGTATVLEQSVIFSILIYGLIDTPIFKNDLAIIWWLIIAMFLTKNNLSNETKNIR